MEAQGITAESKLFIRRFYFALDADSHSRAGLTSSVSDINKFFWLLLNHFRISQVRWTAPPLARQHSVKAFKGVTAVFEWIRSCISIYPLYDATQALSMETSFDNGVYFCYVIHHYCPESIRLDRVNKLATQENYRQAMESSWRRFNIPHVIQ
jgi:Calponin homology (CH) domain